MADRTLPGRPRPSPTPSLPLADPVRPPTPPLVTYQGFIVLVGSDTVDVKVGATVHRNVSIAKPLTIDTMQVDDYVGVTWYGAQPFVTVVLGHASAGNRGRPEVITTPPAPINVRVTQGTYGVRLEWDWGGTPQQRADLSYYEVDGRLSGGNWGYNVYPVSEGTREAHYSREPGSNVQCRVRTVDFRGNESDWVVGDTLLVDTVAPPEPIGFTVENGIDGVSRRGMGQRSMRFQTWLDTIYTSQPRMVPLPQAGPGPGLYPWCKLSVLTHSV